jgi:hypothetical protein
MRGIGDSFVILLRCLDAFKQSFHLIHDDAWAAHGKIVAAFAVVSERGVPRQATRRALELFVV